MSEKEILQLFRKAAETQNKINERICGDYNFDETITQPYKISIRVLYINKKGLIEEGVLSEVDLIRLYQIEPKTNPNKYKLIVWYYDGMDERMEYEYEGIDTELLRHVHLMVDISNAVKCLKPFI